MSSPGTLARSAASTGIDSRNQRISTSSEAGNACASGAVWRGRGSTICGGVRWLSHESVLVSGPSVLWSLRRPEPSQGALEVPSAGHGEAARPRGRVDADEAGEEEAVAQCRPSRRATRSTSAARDGPGRILRTAASRKDIRRTGRRATQGAVDGSAQTIASAAQASSQAIQPTTLVAPSSVTYRRMAASPDA